MIGLHSLKVKGLKQIFVLLKRSRYLREEEDRKKSAQMNDMAKKLSEAEMTISLLKMENSNQRSEVSVI